ncbi:hypothetical protein KCP73_00940 [Salmonella enterica subsp. enterica]|nr:hypothetical protein KCP73_00940 [Salmonella enterica subsp. enterica]
MKELMFRWVHSPHRSRRLCPRGATPIGYLPVFPEGRYGTTVCRSH